MKKYYFDFKGWGSIMAESEEEAIALIEEEINNLDTKFEQFIFDIEELS